MRIFRIVVTILFAVTVVLFGVVYINEQRTKDLTLPVITVEGEIIDVKVNATDKDLLKGVTAYDEKDGDLTDKVIVESVSHFVEKGVCVVTYAVCDTNNHVANASRRVRYTDYKSPTIQVVSPLCFAVYSKVDITKHFKVKDCIDGDISGAVVITSPNYENGKIGSFDLEFRVTNRKGDLVELVFPLYIDDTEIGAPLITLDKYSVYGEHTENQYLNMIRSITNAKEEPVETQISIVREVVNNNITCIHYYATNEDGITGHTVLMELSNI